MSSAARAPVDVDLARTEDERRAVFRFRYDVYVREMGKVNLPEADHARGELSDSEDEGAALYVARSAGAIIGTLRARSGAQGIPPRFEELPGFERFLEFPPETLSFTGRLMLIPDARGTAALDALLRRAYVDGLASPAEFDFCHCMPGLVELYEHLGYRRFSDNIVAPVIGYQVPLVLVLRDQDYLRAVKSPLTRALRGEAAAMRPPPRDWLAGVLRPRSTPGYWAGGDAMFWRFLADKVWATTAGTVTLFQGLAREEQHRLMASGSVIEARRGDRVIAAGSVGKEIFIVIEGMVEVRLPGGEEALAVLDVGQVFGEIAFISDCMRTADVFATTDARLLVLTQATLKRLMRAAPELASKVLFNLCRVLCERVVTDNRRQTHMAEEPDPEDQPA